jgi:histidyl-tRNA synthetase
MRPQGTHDILPNEVGEWRNAEGVFRDICRRYRYEEIRTPIFENTDLFVRSIGDGTDIVSKEMYTFQDRSGNSLTLRAEGTAPTIRAYLDNNLHAQDRERVVKLFYISPIFRHDRPQAGRYRQHHQCGIEVIGSQDPALDAEVIQLARGFFQELDIGQVELRLNSVGCSRCRPVMEGTLRSFLTPNMNGLCDLCRHRFEKNLLRVLDCKNPMCQAVITDEDVAENTTALICGECRDHFEQVQEILRMIGIEYVLDARLVRGLDYYTKTAFEFKARGLGSQDSIGGGGRYDGLVERCGGPPTPGVGVGMGLERILMVRDAVGASLQDVDRHGILMVTLGDEAWREGLRMMSSFRSAGMECDIDYRRRSLRSQLGYANSDGFEKVVILGENEMAKGTCMVKEMESGSQVEVARGDVITHILSEGGDR